MARIARFSHGIGDDVMPLCLALGPGDDLAVFRKGFFHENMTFLSQCLVDFASSPATRQERRAVTNRAISSWMQENPDWERRCMPLPSGQQMSLLSVTDGADLTRPPQAQVDLSQLFGNPSIAVILDNPVLLCAMLNNGADVNDLYPYHLWRSPIRRTHLLYTCVFYDSVECFNALMLEKEVDVNSIGDESGQVLLHCLFFAAIATGLTEHTSLSFLRSLVRHPSIDPDEPFSGGDATRTPLRAAIWLLLDLDDGTPPHRCLAVVQTLIGAGANIQRERFGVSPLQFTRTLAEDEAVRRSFLQANTAIPGGNEGLAQRSQQLLGVMQTRPATIINSVARGYLVRRQSPRMLRHLRRICPTAYMRRPVGG